MSLERKLSPHQRYVLCVFANRGATHCKDQGAWYPLRSAQVYSIVAGLSRRGLVDVAGIHVRHTKRGGAWGNSRHLRTFKLTAKGHAAVAAMTDDEKAEAPMAMRRGEE